MDWWVAEFHTSGPSNFLFCFWAENIFLPNVGAIFVAPCRFPEMTTRRN